MSSFPAPFRGPLYTCIGHAVNDEQRAPLLATSVKQRALLPCFTAHAFQNLQLTLPQIFPPVHPTSPGTTCSIEPVETGNPTNPTY